MSRFFVPLPLVSGASIALPYPVVRHIHVLRLTLGDAITLFNGTGGEFSAVLTAIDKKHALVTLGQHHAREVELPYQIILAQGIASSNKMDWLIEKGGELGVSAVIPLITSKSVVRYPPGERSQRRRAHWEALVRAACEQCGRNRLPTIEAPTTFNAWLTALPTVAPTLTRLMLSPQATQGVEILPPMAPREPTILLIGPEGGFTKAEEALAIAYGFTALHLGPRILRTETAGMAMLAGLAMRWGGWL